EAQEQRIDRRPFDDENMSQSLQDVGAGVIENERKAVPDGHAQKQRNQKHAGGSFGTRVGKRQPQGAKHAFPRQSPHAALRYQPWKKISARRFPLSPWADASYTGWESPTASIRILFGGTPSLISSRITAVARACERSKLICSRRASETLVEATDACPT